MATPGQLINGMALALNLPRETVTVYDRFLVESGFRTKGGRGRSAAKVTTADAATLLATILMAEEIIDAENAAKVAHWMTVENFEIENQEKYAIPMLKSLAEDGGSFVDFLSLIISLSVDGKECLTNGTAIEVEKGTPYANIDLVYAKIYFDLAKKVPEDIEGISQRFLKSRIQITSTILVDSITDIADIFR